MGNSVHPRMKVKNIYRNSETSSTQQDKSYNAGINQRLQRHAKKQENMPPNMLL